MTLTVNYHAGSTRVGIVNSSYGFNIVAGLYIDKAPVTSGFNLAGSNAAPPLGDCRVSYSQITANPKKSFNCVPKIAIKSILWNICNSQNLFRTS
jgi:hypothetical protein